MEIVAVNGPSPSNFHSNTD